MAQNPPPLVFPCNPVGFPLTPPPLYMEARAGLTGTGAPKQICLSGTVQVGSKMCEFKMISSLKPSAMAFIGYRTATKPRRKGYTP